ncbi:MAG: pyruvate, phosphate dikinase [bacterium]
MTTQTLQKKVYFFGNKETEGNRDQRNLLGGKGANLAEMTNLNIPVPPGFTITTNECLSYYKNNQQLSKELLEEIVANIKKIEKSSNKIFGDSENPLLFSVRSGARISMPGMMDTILNLGLNDEAVEGLSKQSQSEQFAWDSYRRFIQMFSSVVLEIEHHLFEEELTKLKQEINVELDMDLSAEHFKKLVQSYKKIIASNGKTFPQDPVEQLTLAISAVFNSWESERAYKYRKINKIPDHWGTAVNVQSMVFGNLGDDSGTGVCFTRNPSTGENKFYGEYLVNAQGEDVVAGIRTPEEIEKLNKIMPTIYKELVDIYKRLEQHFKEMQDMEFTIEKGKLYILQTRTGKRTAAAAIKIAVDMEKEKLIDKETALLRVTGDQLDQLLHPTIDPNAKVSVLAKGLPASPGAAVGQLVFNADDAEKWTGEGKQVLLIREETSPEDIGGMHAACGILTARGGMTSHAAVVARGMGKCCVAGCQTLQISAKAKTLKINDKTFKEGDYLSLNGTSGEVIEGKAPLQEVKTTEEFTKLLGWANDIRRLKVRTNAETEEDVKTAVKFGAEGIGLCRTEHMFFEAERIDFFREMILADTQEKRKEALNKLFLYQKEDFLKIFKLMPGLPITIRLLDPPLHEFLPHEESQIEELAKKIKTTKDSIKKKINSLHEQNPMLGHRGCRLAITYPEIYEMQTKAIIQAAIEAQQANTIVNPEIMIPLIGDVNELKTLRELVENTVKEILNKNNIHLNYQIGTMIEVPRAALMADKVASAADFFSFGTNDLTQMTYGLSRDDSSSFIPEYLNKKVWKEDPFQVLDQEGIGELIKIAIKKGRTQKSNLKIGICGEHGGEPRSVGFCHREKFDYVSCSPYRIPIAILSAAQEKIRHPE